MRSKRGALLLGVVLLSAVFTPLGVHYVNYDAAWLLYCAGQVLEGADLYVDLFETTPPPATLINVPPALAAELSGVAPVHLFPLWAFGLCLAPLALVWRILRADERGGNGLVFWLVLLVTAVILVLPAWQFGQREHFFYALFLPYVFTLDARLRDSPPPASLAAITGLLAGLGMSIKPFFVLPWLAVEAYLAYHAVATGRAAAPEPTGPPDPAERREPPGRPRRGRREGAVRRYLTRPEPWTAAGVLGTLAAATLLFAPEYLRLMREQVVPLYPHFLELSLPTLLTRPPSLLAVAALVFVPVVRVRPEWRPTVRLLAALVTGSLAAYLVQRKGFPYQGYPAAASATLLLGLGLAASRDARELVDRLSTGWIAAIAGVLIVAFGGSQLLMPRSAVQGTRLTPGSFGELRDRVEDRVEGRPVAAFSFRMLPAFPLVNYTGAGWGTRYPNLWPLAAALHLEMKEDASRAARGRAFRSRILGSLVSDLLRSRPVLLLVDEGPVLGPPGFDFVSHLSRDPALRDLMREYRRGERIGHTRLYWRDEATAGRDDATTGPAARRRDAAGTRQGSVGRDPSVPGRPTGYGRSRPACRSPASGPRCLGRGAPPPDGGCRSARSTPWSRRSRRVRR